MRGMLWNPIIIEWPINEIIKVNYQLLCSKIQDIRNSIFRDSAKAVEDWIS